MKKNIEALLPPAMQAIKQVLKPDKLPIQAEYQGYISAFGASVMQMGLLPTMAVFADEDSGSAENRGSLLRILHRIVTSDASSLSPQLKQKLGEADDQLFQHLIDLSDDKAKMRTLRAHLLDAAVATKLAIRTFKLSRDAQ